MIFHEEFLEKKMMEKSPEVCSKNVIISWGVPKTHEGRRWTPFDLRIHVDHVFLDVHFFGTYFIQFCRSVLHGWISNPNFQADQPSLDISADYGEVTSPSPVTQSSQDSFEESHLLAGAHRYVGTHQIICISSQSKNSRHAQLQSRETEWFRPT